MKRFIGILVLMLAAGSGRLQAQFTVPTSETPRLAPIPDTAYLRPQTIDNRFFSLARWKAERRALRRQRNSIEFNASLTASQTQFVNWQAGGENTFSARSTLSYRHLYKIDKFNFDYRFDARYGMNYIQDKMFKNEDEFKFSIQAGWQMYRNWSYAMTVNLRSQFTEGYRSRTDNTVVSRFMAPGYLDVAVGFNWKRQGSPWDITISPASGKITMVLDDRLSETGTAGVPKGEKTKGQLGPSLQIYFDKEFFKKVCRYKSNLYSFTNIKKRPTVRWENTLEIKATKLLTTKLYGLMNYDCSTGTDKPQYNYSISVGLAYTIKNK